MSVIVRVRFNEALMAKETARDLIVVAALEFQGIGYDLKTGLRDVTWFASAAPIDLEQLRRQAHAAERRRGVIDVEVDAPGWGSA